MAAEWIFDTLKLASRLEREAGVDTRLAAVLSMGLADELGERPATKTDLEREIRGVRTDLGAEIQDLRAELHVLGWMLKTTLAGVAALLVMVIPMVLKTLQAI